jgi:hypothetical protein
MHPPLYLQPKPRGPGVAWLMISCICHDLWQFLAVPHARSPSLTLEPSRCPYTLIGLLTSELVTGDANWGHLRVGAQLPWSPFLLSKKRSAPWRLGQASEATTQPALLAPMVPTTLSNGGQSDFITPFKYTCRPRGRLAHSECMGEPNRPGVRPQQGPPVPNSYRLLPIKQGPSGTLGPGYGTEAPNFLAARQTRPTKIS